MRHDGKPFPQRDTVWKHILLPRRCRKVERAFWFTGGPHTWIRVCDDGLRQSSCMRIESRCDSGALSVPEPDREPRARWWARGHHLLYGLRRNPSASNLCACSFPITEQRLDAEGSHRRPPADHGPADHPQTTRRPTVLRTIITLPKALWLSGLVANLLAAS